MDDSPSFPTAKKDALPLATGRVLALQVHTGNGWLWVTIANF